MGLRWKKRKKKETNWDENGEKEEKRKKERPNGRIEKEERKVEKKEKRKGKKKKEGESKVAASGSLGICLITEMSLSYEL